MLFSLLHQQRQRYISSISRCDKGASSINACQRRGRENIDHAWRMKAGGKRAAHYCAVVPLHAMGRKKRRFITLAGRAYTCEAQSCARRRARLRAFPARKVPRRAAVTCRRNALPSLRRSPRAPAFFGVIFCACAAGERSRYPHADMRHEPATDVTAADLSRGLHRISSFVSRAVLRLLNSVPGRAFKLRRRQNRAGAWRDNTALDVGTYSPTSDGCPRLERRGVATPGPDRHIHLAYH